MLGPRELATVLAALRHWQLSILAPGNSLVKGFPHFVEFSPLPASEIDKLCERLNAAGAVAPEPCECECPGIFYSGVPGILAAVGERRLFAWRDCRTVRFVRAVCQRRRRTRRTNPARHGS